MAKRKRAIPQYGTVTLNGIDYYRTRVQNAGSERGFRTQMESWWLFMREHRKNYMIISIPPPSGGTNSNESVLRLQVFVLQLTQLLRHPGINIRCTHPFTVDVQVRLFS